MDDELRELAVLALKNAFYEGFSSLVNTYIDAAEGLGCDTLEMQLSDTANVFSRDDEAPINEPLNIWTQGARGRWDTVGHNTVLEALEFESAIEVHLQGAKVFERIDGEWNFVNNQP